MAAGDRDSVNRLLAQLVGKLAQLYEELVPKVVVSPFPLNRLDDEGGEERAEPFEPEGEKGPSR